MAELFPVALPSHLPGDLDAFWERTLERSRGQALGVEVEPGEGRLPYYVERVTFRGLDGVPVRAYLSYPAEAKPADANNPRAGRRFPAIVTGPGYGGWEFGQTLSECQRGYIVLQVFPRSQGESGELWRLPDEAYGDWIRHGCDDPEGYFYQGALVDLVRGVDYLLTREDVDPDRIGAIGTSQGGMLVLGVAGIDTRIKAVVAHVPALCALRYAAGTFRGEDLRQDPEFLRTWDYFDPVHLAHRIKAPALLSSGGQDGVCPSPSIQAVYEQLGGIKALAHYPGLIHTSCTDFYHMSWDWLARYLR